MPIPGTSPSSSMARNPPWATLQSTIRWASTGPTLGSASSSSSVAVFRSTRWSPDGPGVAPGAGVVATCGAAVRAAGPDHDLLPVHEEAGQVHRAQGSARAQPAGGIDGVHDP